MKIAYFSPLSPLKSGIVDYSEQELLPFLKNYCEIDIYIDEGYTPTNKDIISKFNIYNYKKFLNGEGYDAILYHIGNNSQHIYIYEVLKKYPGIVILHDTFIHGLIWSKTLAKNDKKGYIKEFAQMYGEKGIKIAEYTINNQNFMDTEFKYSLIKTILECSRGIIVHSDFSKKIALDEKHDIIVKKINHPLTPSSILNVESDRIRKELGVNRDTLIIGSFGFISAHKRMSVLLKVYKKFHDKFLNSILLIVGEDNIGLKDKIKEYGITSAIQMGFVPFKKMYEYINVADICVNLRYPTAGETSGSILRLMSMNKPVIVSNIGWFAELPENCCPKIDIDNYEEDILLEYLSILVYNKNLRIKMSENAKKYILEECDPNKIAKEYYVFIDEIIKKKKQAQFINEISDDMADIGIKDTDDYIIRDVAIILKELDITI